MAYLFCFDSHYLDIYIFVYLIVLLGYWTTELGGLNQVVHLWEYGKHLFNGSTTNVRIPPLTIVLHIF